MISMVYKILSIIINILVDYRGQSAIEPMVEHWNKSLRYHNVDVTSSTLIELKDVTLDFDRNPIIDIKCCV